MSTDPAIITDKSPEEVVYYPADTESFKSWMFEKISPYIRRPTLEMGSGLGAVSALLAEKGFAIHLSDSNKSNRDALRRRFHGTEFVQHVHNIDFCHPEFELRYSQVFGSFACILALNVLENGYYAKLAFLNARHLLQKRGRMILIAPVYTSMLGGLNDNKYAWRKYNGKGLEELLTRNFEIIKMRYLNLGSAVTTNGDSPLGLSVLAIARRLDG